MTDELQDEAVAYLRAGDWAEGEEVEVIETHGAYVFLAGETALKIKRAVKYDYMDLSTCDLREAMLRRELALNRPGAPEIYRDVLPVTRSADGQLALDGRGEPVEWVLRMHRFPAEDELTEVAARGDLDDGLADALGQAVFAYHRESPRRHADGAKLIGDIAEEFRRVFSDMEDVFGTDRLTRLHARLAERLAETGPLLSRRSGAGHVRRCHGDLHLRNIVLIDGRPVPFDALEFDETLGTCDVLYDLAFLLMDLTHRGLCRAANIALNAYLLEAGGREDAGLAALPLFLAVRAAVRAMVTVQGDRAGGHPHRSDDDARLYLDAALVWLDPVSPRLVAVGGVSGTGKTVLSGALAPGIGVAPGAVHLRSDLERKAMRGLDATARLPDEEYSAAARDAVYQRLLERAGTILGAGHSALLDATFLSPEDRDGARALADRLGVAFAGLWLEAPRETLLSRVKARRGDASDADAGVVRKQLSERSDPAGWIRVAAGGTPADTLAAARAALRSS